MGGHDQSQMKMQFKKFEKLKFVPIYVPKSHNDDIACPKKYCFMNRWGDALNNEFTISLGFLEPS